MTSRVYVVQETDRNILPAKSFGDLFVIFDQKELALGYHYMVEKLYRVMANIRPYDFILCIGDPVAIGLTIHVALDITDGKVGVLKWNKQRYQYDKEDIVI